MSEWIVFATVAGAVEIERSGNTIPGTQYLTHN